MIIDIGYLEEIAGQTVQIEHFPKIPNCPGCEGFNPGGTLEKGVASPLDRPACFLGDFPRGWRYAKSVIDNSRQTVKYEENELIFHHSTRKEIPP